jgi:hypothetical protein
MEGSLPWKIEEILWDIQVLWEYQGIIFHHQSIIATY